MPNSATGRSTSGHGISDLHFVTRVLVGQINHYPPHLVAQLKSTIDPHRGDWSIAGALHLAKDLRICRLAQAIEGWRMPRFGLRPPPFSRSKAGQMKASSASAAFETWRSMLRLMRTRIRHARIVASRQLHRVQLPTRREWRRHPHTQSCRPSRDARRRCDYVALTTALTDETRNMIRRRRRSPRFPSDGADAPERRARSSSSTLAFALKNGLRSGKCRRRISIDVYRGRVRFRPPDPELLAHPHVLNLTPH